MTVEEKAKEYSNSEGIYNEHGERLLYMGYLAGYKEATRWRDPKEELPEEAGLYLCKCKSNRLGFYFEIVFFNKVWRSDKVIGWRPIE
jgi:hypothetical protein